jgi:hypothetical protein
MPLSASVANTVAAKLLESGSNVRVLGDISGLVMQHLNALSKQQPDLQFAEPNQIVMDTLEKLYTDKVFRFSEDGGNPNSLLSNYLEHKGVRIDLEPPK